MTWIRQVLIQERHRISEEAIAEQLSISTRTLVRRLDRCGTSFSKIQQQIRQEQAEHLLRLGKSIEYIAEQLGYNDTSNFTRAYRRWFKVPPSHRRRQ